MLRRVLQQEVLIRYVLVVERVQQFGLPRNAISFPNEFCFTLVSIRCSSCHIRRV